MKQIKYFFIREWFLIFHPNSCTHINFNHDPHALGEEFYEKVTKQDLIYLGSHYFKIK